MAGFGDAGQSLLTSHTLHLSDFMTGTIIRVLNFLDSVTTGITVGSINPNYASTFTLGDGAGANQANRLWQQTYTIAANNHTDITLSSLGSDAFGRSIAPTRIVALVILHSSGPALSVGGADSHAWTAAFSGTLALGVGGEISLTSPGATAYPVVSGANDVLRLSNADLTTAASVILLVVCSQ